MKAIVFWLLDVALGEVLVTLVKLLYNKARQHGPFKKNKKNKTDATPTENKRRNQHKKHKSKRR